MHAVGIVSPRPQVANSFMRCATISYLKEKLSVKVWFKTFSGWRCRVKGQSQLSFQFRELRLIPGQGHWVSHKLCAFRSKSMKKGKRKEKPRSFAESIAETEEKHLGGFVRTTSGSLWRSTIDWRKPYIASDSRGWLNKLKLCLHSVNFVTHTETCVEWENSPTAAALLHYRHLTDIQHTQSSVGYLND